jgi:HK97 family phage major capsid protein
MYGLKGKVREMVTEMDTIRNPGKEQLGRDVTLRAFMADKYKDGSGQPLGPEHLFAELGVDEFRTTMHELLNDEDNKYLVAELIRESARRVMGLTQREQMAELRKKAMSVSFAPITGEYAGGQRFISPEIFMDPVNRGAVQGTFYPDLIIREIPVAQPQVIVPKVDISDAALADSNEAATIEEGSISYSTKTVTITKKAKAIKVTDEAVRFSSIALLDIFLQDFGRLFGNTLNGMAVDAIVNGDQADNSEAATVIGVLNTANKITWADYVQVAVRFGLIGQSGTQIIANEATANDFLNLTEVKNKTFNGNPLLNVNIRTPLTMPEDLYVSAHVAANKVVVQDPSSSIVQLTAAPLMVETDRIVMKQITGTALSIYTGFAKIQRKASIVIDGSILFSGNGFPTYMTPVAG